MSDLRSIFSRASVDFMAANPCLTAQPEKKNDAQPIVAAKRRGSMNKTEAEFAMILESMRNRGEITQWRFESVKLKLADDCWYTPDFFVERNEGCPFFAEIKGSHIWDDAKVKFKCAIELHRWADFQLHQKTREGWKQLI